MNDDEMPDDDEVREGMALVDSWIDRLVEPLATSGALVGGLDEDEVSVIAMAAMQRYHDALSEMIESDEVPFDRLLFRLISNRASDVIGQRKVKSMLVGALLGDDFEVDVQEVRLG